MRQKQIVVLDCRSELIDKPEGITIRSEFGEYQAFISHREVKDLINYFTGYLEYYNELDASVPVLPVDDSRKERAPLEHRAVPSIDTLSSRSARTTEPLKVGDPFLATSVPSASNDGKQKIMEVQGMDLAVEARRVGVPIGSVRSS